MKDRALVSIDRPLQDSSSPERGLNYQEHVQGSGTVLCLRPRGHPVLGFYSGSSITGQLSGDSQEFSVLNCEEIIEEAESWWDAVHGDAELNKQNPHCLVRCF